MWTLSLPKIWLRLPPELARFGGVRRCACWASPKFASTFDASDFASPQASTSINISIVTIQEHPSSLSISSSEALQDTFDAPGYLAGNLKV